MSRILYKLGIPTSGFFLAGLLGPGVLMAAFRPVRIAFFGLTVGAASVVSAFWQWNAFLALLTFVGGGYVFCILVAFVGMFICLRLESRKSP